MYALLSRPRTIDHHETQIDFCCIYPINLLAGISSSEKEEIPRLWDFITAYSTALDCVTAFASVGKPINGLGVDNDGVSFRVPS